MYFVVYSIRFQEYFVVSKDWINDLSWEKCVNNSINRNQEYLVYYSNMRLNEEIVPNFHTERAENFLGNGTYICKLRKYFGKVFHNIHYIFLYFYSILNINCVHYLNLQHLKDAYGAAKVYCDARRRLIPPAIYNRRRIFEQPIPNIQVNPIENGNNGNQLNELAENPHNINIDDELVANENADNSESTINESMEFLGVTPVDLSVDSIHNPGNDLLAVTENVQSGSGTLVNTNNNFQPAMDVAENDQFVLADGQSGTRPVASSAAAENAQFGSAADIEQFIEGNPEVKIEPNIIRMSVDDERFIDEHLTEDEDESLTEDDGGNEEQAEKIDEDTDKLIFVNSIGVEVDDVPLPLNTDADGLIKMEDDAISGDKPFRESVCNTKLHFLIYI